MEALPYSLGKRKKKKTPPSQKTSNMLSGKTRNFWYLLSLTPALFCMAGNLLGSGFALANTLYSLGFLAVLEWVTKPVSSNLATAKDDAIPKLILLLHIPFQIGSIGTFIYGVQNETLQGIWLVAAAISTGINSGSSAIVVSHEFIHRKNSFEQFLGRFLLFTAGNMYFFIDHLRVHHKWVGTLKDHATARKGENLYAFFLRSALGQFIGAISLENERLKKEGKSNWLFNHYVFRQLILHACFDSCLYFIGGGMLVAVWFLHCIVANFLLEYVNYVQHYGLNRPEKSRVTEEHSWDSDLFVSRFVLVDLSRHADHHYYASKPYHTLINYEKSPKMPSGYAGMFVMAAIPPLWFKMIHLKMQQEGV
jgi:alkane 1-monooxygenase